MVLYMILNLDRDHTEHFCGLPQLLQVSDWIIAWNKPLSLPSQYFELTEVAENTFVYLYTENAMKDTVYTRQICDTEEDIINKTHFLKWVFKFQINLWHYMKP
jgi:hypothetical protein